MDFEFFHLAMCIFFEGSPTLEGDMKKLWYQKRETLAAPKSKEDHGGASGNYFLPMSFQYSSYIEQYQNSAACSISAVKSPLILKVSKQSIPDDQFFI